MCHSATIPFIILLLAYNPITIRAQDTTMTMAAAADMNTTMAAGAAADETIPSHPKLIPGATLAPITTTAAMTTTKGKGGGSSGFVVKPSTLITIAGVALAIAIFS